MLLVMKGFSIKTLFLLMTHTYAEGSVVAEEVFPPNV